MIRETRVPPDARINAGRQVEPLQVFPGLFTRAFRMRRARPRRHQIGDFAFARVPVHARFGRRRRRIRIRRRPAVPRHRVHHVILRRIELALREELQQIRIPAVPVDDDHFPAAVPRHLGHRLLQQFQLQFRAVGDRSRLMPRLENLAEIVGRKKDRVLLFRPQLRRITNIEKIRPERA